MPQHKQAKKRVLQSEKRRRHNRKQHAKIKTLYRQVMEESDKDKAGESLKEAAAYMDKMSLKGRIHPNNAARKKSKMAQHVNGL
jgi:small subunit ribosomal protein S20